MKPADIRISHLYKQFKGVKALDGLDLNIFPGEIFGLLGPNGAGKTTTMRILLGLTRPTSGQVEILGLNPLKQARKVRARTGYVMQQTALDLYLTGRENLRLYAELFNLPTRAQAGRIDEVLAWADLTQAANRLVRTYSGGMKRRLSLTASLLHRPAIFLLDEPTLGLDIYSRSQLWELITEMKDRGTTIVLTTHYLEEANQLCDRVGIINAGRLVGLGTPMELKQALVENLYHLTVTFSDSPHLEGLDLPVPAQVRGVEVTFSGPPPQLWKALGILQNRFAENIQNVAYSQPTLDDVFLKLVYPKSADTGSESASPLPEISRQP